MDILDYFVSGGDSERFDFKTHEEAREFGYKLRENIRKEGYSDAITVDISVVVVRVTIDKEALALC